MTTGEVLTAVRSLPDRAVLALTLWGEARGESPTGQAAVAWVIRNRAMVRGWTIVRICLQPFQFSCWLPTLPLALNTKLLFALAEAMVNNQPVTDPSWPGLLRIADGVVGDQLPDPTHGATNYLTSHLYASPDCPAWATVCRVTAVIGAHTFLQEVKASA